MSKLMQLSRFGFVGLIAASVHLGLVILLVQSTGMVPLIANIAGFLVAFQFSYWGHRTWTFSDTTVFHRIALPKLFIVQSSGLLLNEVFFYLFLSLHLPYPLALLLVLILLPFLTFFVNRVWVFSV